jgi:REP element-mobilizing transposase RayT
MEVNASCFTNIWGVLRNNQCIAYEINGIEDHIHIATHIHPTVSLSSLVKDIKVSSSLWIKKNNVFPNFSGWAIGYGAFTYAIKEKDALVNYIRNQEKYHKIQTFDNEYKELLKKHKVDFDPKFI